MLKIQEYEIIEDIPNGVFKALRHGQEWRDLVGDNFVLALYYKIEEQQKRIEELERNKNAAG